jgi:transcriptional regulator with XRE-family HTH domain
MAKISQTKLADLIGVKPNTISNYESSTSSPDLSMFVKIVKVLDISPDKLLGLDGYQSNNNMIIATESQFQYTNACPQCQLRERLIVSLEKTIENLEIRLKDCENKLA